MPDRARPTQFGAGPEICSHAIVGKYTDGLRAVGTNVERAGRTGGSAIGEDNLRARYALPHRQPPMTLRRRLYAPTGAQADMWLG